MHADFFKQGIGSTMLEMGIEKVKTLGNWGITVEGYFNYYRCMMYQETYPGLTGYNYGVYYLRHVV